MELLDRYLKAIGSCLPDKQKDDIIRELSEDIRSRMEEREGELGRPLKEEEIEAILKGYGHPLLVAGRYRQDERSVAFGKQLVGPLLFPFYLKVLQFNLGITTVVLVFIFTVMFLSSSQPLAVLSSVPSVFLYQMLIQFAVVTTIFTVVDQHLAKHPDRWNPRKPNYPYYVNLVETKDTDSVPRIESISKLIGLAVMIGWLRVLQHSPYLVLGPLAGNVKFAPVWHQLYLPVVLLAFVGMAQAAINLLRPDWVQLRAFARVTIGVAVLAMWYFLFKTGPWLLPGDTPANLPSVSVHTLEVINECLHYVFLGAAIISGLQLLYDLYRLARGTHPRVPSRA